MYTVTDPAAGSTRARTYGTLKAALLRGDFGVGSRLGEERLAADLGVSRTPVREAMSRLYSEGFVTPHVDGGFAPVVPDLPTVHELYEVRFALERWAVLHPTLPEGRHDIAALEALRADWEAIESSAFDGEDVQTSFVVLDEEFHVRLAASGGNRSLARMLQSVNERIRVVRIHDFVSADRIARTVVQHLVVLEAVLAGDLALAELRLVGHFEESLAVVEHRAALAIARMLQRPRP